VQRGENRRRAPRVLVMTALGLLLASSTGCSAGAQPGTAAGTASTHTGATTPSAGATAPSAGATTGSATPAPRSPDQPTPPTGSSSADQDPPGSTIGSFVAVGDSITAGSTPLVGDVVPSVGSWIPAADSPPLHFAGGWAVPGATTAAMRAAVQPMQADALVLLGGTNDLLQGLDRTAALANLSGIADEVAAPTVLLVAVPPLDIDPTASVRFNEQLRVLAAERGWRFVDPWEGVGVDGTYLPEASGDGIHPGAEAADLVGGRIRTALLYGG
jgi:lysophospholipase L1-like esterase